MATGESSVAMRRSRTAPGVNGGGEPGPDDVGEVPGEVPEEFAVDDPGASDEDPEPVAAGGRSVHAVDATRISTAPTAPTVGPHTDLLTTRLYQRPGAGGERSAQSL